MSYYPDLGHSTDSLKRKFASLYNHKKPTGNPNCPPHVVCRAKTAWENIKSSMDIGVDDDRTSIRGDDQCNGAEENHNAHASDPPALPPRNVSDADDISSTNMDSLSFSQQMSAPRVARSLARHHSTQQSCSS